MIPQGGTLPDDSYVLEEQASLTYALDPVGGRISGKADGLAAIRQAVFKILQTDRFAHAIYNGNYGFESSFDLQGEVFRLETGRRITEALLADSRIRAVEQMRFEEQGDAATVSFTVVTDQGSFLATGAVSGNG
ncbi:DUF2634 domain-containing protein [Paenibacillus sp. 1P07SE]|uniref:DUF2634 domain-containing protein n=1 Tax=Paenibacillus sp. 1P07SE TaxID=3132209 RepID=UPI0039A5C1CC